MGIAEDLQAILEARYGRDVRQAIHDGIEAGYNIAVQAQGTAETSQDSAEAYAAAALASEQAAQGYMELAEQYKNEAYSGTPTGYSDLVAKVNSIYQETADSFSLEDTVEGLALAHTIYGMSEQDGTPTPNVPVDIDSAVANFTCANSDSTDTITITTNLTLRAIEVASTDAYNLVKDGKYYLADSVDWSEDDGYVLTRRVEHLDFDSTWYSINFDNSGKFFTYYLPNEKPVSPNFTFVSNWAKTNSNRFIEGAIGNLSPDTVGLGGIVASNNYCRVGIDSTIATSLADVRTWIANNPLYIEYILATPTTESITSAQAQALLGIKTYDEATNIDCVEDVAPVMDLEYSKDRYTALALTGHNMAYINDLRIGELENA